MRADNTKPTPWVNLASQSRPRIGSVLHHSHQVVGAVQGRHDLHAPRQAGSDGADKNGTRAMQVNDVRSKMLQRPLKLVAGDGGPVAHVSLVVQRDHRASEVQKVFMRGCGRQADDRR